MSKNSKQKQDFKATSYGISPQMVRYDLHLTVQFIYPLYFVSTFFLIKHQVNISYNCEHNVEFIKAWKPHLSGEIDPHRQSCMSRSSSTPS
jgi:hypothetical protein